jgi:hypothetical protein
VLNANHTQKNLLRAHLVKWKEGLVTFHLGPVMETIEITLKFMSKEKRESVWVPFVILYFEIPENVHSLTMFYFCLVPFLWLNNNIFLENRTSAVSILRKKVQHARESREA